jgi:hypothetical protein
MKEVKERKAFVFAVDTDEYIPEGIINDTFRQYSIPIKGKEVLMGLTFDEIEKCRELVTEIGVSPNSPNFTEAVNDFYIDWNYKIPVTRLSNGEPMYSVLIDGSYTKQDGVIIPKVLNDFILYQVMQLDTVVGKSEEDLLMSSQFDFFLLDTSEKEAFENKKAETQMAYTLKLAEIFSSENVSEYIKQVLLIGKKHTYGEIHGFTDAQLPIEITKFAQKETELFLQIVGTKDLKQKAFARELILTDIVKKVADTYFDGDIKIGGIKELMLYIKDPANIQTLERFESDLTMYKLRNIVNA